ncbi:ATP-dependent helicase [candidate division Kazan bacterium]|uniref:DNA 3'-5' helicase n=1 Tax=candidate division Kazan bacterium TaxID=2202143 RepID=A0A420ZBS7_UNCK3|nr:MAG: ATP-dependent helicase [candidate division Kazan bacterium]
MIDWSKCITIDSGSELTDIEHHFRVFAGPGAGKTYWLTNHIQNVLRQSKRLGSCGKIACITYTNAGVEEIQRRLRKSANRVEVATIHSFLYSNVIKPYAFLLKDDDGGYIINIERLDGHAEHIPSLKIMYEWKKDNKLAYLRDKKKIYECLINLDWCFQDEELVCLPRDRYKLKVGRYSISKSALQRYKQYYWSRGELHHEDVLFFSYLLIKNHPEILPFLRARFPYVFVDEFQDTNPIQTRILRWIAQEATIVGVIGDLAQSIYGFQGACREDFENFILDNSVDYKIENNRRSTENIIHLLNHIRGDDIKQKSVTGKKGEPVKLIVGCIHDCIEKIMKEAKTVPMVLVRRNDYVGQIRSQSDYKLDKLWDDLRNIDSNLERTSFVYAMMFGVELAIQKDFKESVKGIERSLKKSKNGKPIPKYKKRQAAIDCLQKAVNEWEKWKGASLLEFNNHFVEYLDEKYDIKAGASITRGKIKDFAEVWKCKDFVQCLRLKDDKSLIRTIHKAKGGEYDTVLVGLENEDDLEYIINPDIDHNKNDECRIYYVALSRAKENLFICTPTLNVKRKAALQELGVSIEVL